MPLKEVICYQAVCDGCGADVHEGTEYGSMGDASGALDVATDCDWIIANLPGVRAHVLICTRCAPDPAERTDEQYDCCHAALEPTGRDREWSCPACRLTVGQPVFKARAEKKLAEHRAQVEALPNEDVPDLLGSLQASIDRARVARGASEVVNAVETLLPCLDHPTGRTT